SSTPPHITRKSGSTSPCPPPDGSPRPPRPPPPPAQMPQQAPQPLITHKQVGIQQRLRISDRPPKNSPVRVERQGQSWAYRSDTEPVAWRAWSCSSHVYPAPCRSP